MPKYYRQIFARNTKDIDGPQAVRGLRTPDIVYDVHKSNKILPSVTKCEPLCDAVLPTANKYKANRLHIRLK